MAPAPHAGLDDRIASVGVAIVVALHRRHRGCHRFRRIWHARPAAGSLRSAALLPPGCSAPGRATPRAPHSSCGAWPHRPRVSRRSRHRDHVCGHLDDPGAGPGAAGLRNSHLRRPLPAWPRAARSPQVVGRIRRPSRRAGVVAAVAFIPIPRAGGAARPIRVDLSCPLTVIGERLAIALIARDRTALAAIPIATAATAAATLPLSAILTFAAGGVAIIAAHVAVEGFNRIGLDAVAIRFVLVREIARPVAAIATTKLAASTVAVSPHGTPRSRSPRSGRSRSRSRRGGGGGGGAAPPRRFLALEAPFHADGGAGRRLDALAARARLRSMAKLAPCMRSLACDA